MLFSILINCCFGQQPYFYELNHQAGLPSNEVYTICQDNFNALWIGSDAGLLRYDGLTFQTLGLPGNKRLSISNVQLFQGRTVWCQNFAGQIYTMDQNESRLNLAFDATKYVRNFPNYTLDKEGKAWVMTDSILFIVKPDLSVQKSFSVGQLSMKSAFFASIGTTSMGDIAVVGYQGKLATIAPKSGAIQHWELPYELGYRYQFFQSKEELHLLIERTHLGRLQYAMIDLNQSMDEIQLKWENFENANVLVHVFDEEKHYFGTDKGLYIKSKNSQQVLFKGKKISHLFKDKEGSIWCTSLQDGIFVIPSMDLLMWTNEVSKISDQNITAVASNNDVITLGNYSGELFQLNKSTGELTPCYSSPVPTRAVRKIEYRKDTLYVARGEFQIYAKEKLAHTISELRNTRDFQLSGDTLFYTRSDLTGYVLFNGKRWENHIIRNKGGRKIRYTSKGVFIFFSDGLFCWKNGKIKEIKYKGISLQGNSLTEVEDGVLLGTNNLGVLRYQSGKVSLVLDQSKGLPNDEILNFYATQNEYIIATRGGLSIFNKKNGKLNIVDEFDGLAVKEVSDILVSDGIIYLATINGLISLPLSQKTINSVAPTLKMKGISVNGKERRAEGSLYLAYNDYQVTFQLSSVSLRSRGNYKLKYRLLGLTDAWTIIEARQNSVTFPSIPSGSYTFEVIAMNEDGIESPVVQKTVLVNSPVWQKPWFYMILLFICAAIMFFTFRWRLNSVRKKALLKQKMVSAQLTALKAQMNPHFLFNTLNSLQDLILKQDFKSTNYYLSKYSQLMRMILTNSEKGEVEIGEELNMLDLYLDLEKLRFGDDFVYELICDEQLQISNLTVPPMVIQPFVENAIKHGLMHKQGKKQLTIHFYQKTDEVFCEITDNGVGRMKSAEINERQGRNYRSFSTEATDERLRLLQDYYGKSYQFEIMDLMADYKSVGTKVIIQFPIS